MLGRSPSIGILSITDTIGAIDKINKVEATDVNNIEKTKHMKAIDKQIAARRSDIVIEILKVEEIFKFVIIDINAKIIKTEIDLKTKI